MNTKTKAVVFISMLVLIFSATACKQSGEAEKPVKADEAVSGAVEEVSIKVDEAVSGAAEEVSIKVDETVDNATEEVNKKVDDTVDKTTEEVNKNIDDASKNIGGALGINTEE
jgi:hypothetical protein